MTGILILGFLVGMRHALEADHVAAVASLATGARSTSHTVSLGMAWGIGHTVTLLLVGCLVLAADTVVPDAVARGLETAVGVMLTALGLDVLRRLRRERVHFHVHRHADGLTHVHAHSHGGEDERHDATRHAHAHAPPGTARALLVGLVHGLAGSAALVLLVLGSVDSYAYGVAYIVLFGLGSVAGMAALSVAISWPLRVAGRSLTRLDGALRAGVGVGTTLIGVLAIRHGLGG